MFVEHKNSLLSRNGENIVKTFQGIRNASIEIDRIRSDNLNFFRQHDTQPDGNRKDSEVRAQALRFLTVGSSRSGQRN